MTMEAENITSSLSGSEKLLETVKAALMKHIEETSENKLEVNNVINEKNAVKTQLEMLDSNITRTILENDSILLAKQENQKKNSITKKQKDELTSKRDESKTNYALLQKQIEQAKSSEQNMKTNIEILQSNYKLIYDMEKQMHGYKQDVKAVLENKALDGIIDVVANLMGTEEIYNTAIEAALGGNIQNVVVEDEESAKTAISYLKAFKDNYQINDYYFDQKNLHLHFLEAAVAKDGPSAGVAIVTSLLSLLLNKTIPQDIAMTGEISLRGDILPVGGLKEKIIGGYNNRIKTFIIPWENEKDLVDIPQNILLEIKIMPIKNYQELYDYLFKQ